MAPTIIGPWVTGLHVTGEARARVSGVTFQDCFPGLVVDGDAGVSVDNTTFAHGDGGNRNWYFGPSMLVQDRGHVIISQSTVIDGIGIEVLGASKVEVDHSRLVRTGIRAGGVEFGAAIRARAESTVVIRDSTLSDNLVNGIECDGTATVTVRSTEILRNGAHGVFVDGGCVVNLSADVDGGRSVLNRTSERNLGAGVCVVRGGNVQAIGVTWSCAIDAGCSSGQPVGVPNAAACQAGVDWSASVGSTVADGNATCCY